MTALAGTTSCNGGSIGSNCVGGSNDGIGTNAQLWNPKGLVVNPLGTVLYVTDYSNNIIRAIILTSGNKYTNHSLLFVYAYMILMMSQTLLFYSFLLFA